MLPTSNANSWDRIGRAPCVPSSWKMGHKIHLKAYIIKIWIHSIGRFGVKFAPKQVLGLYYSVYCPQLSEGASVELCALIFRSAISKRLLSILHLLYHHVMNIGQVQRWDDTETLLAVNAFLLAWTPRWTWPRFSGQLEIGSYGASVKQEECRCLIETDTSGDYAALSKFSDIRTVIFRTLI